MKKALLIFIILLIPCISFAQGVTKEQIAPWRVQAGSPAIHGGANLWVEMGCDTKPENCKDIAGTPLPRTGPWPIGAVMYTPPPAPPAIKVVK